MLSYSYHLLESNSKIMLIFMLALIDIVIKLDN